ncbi:hypothetical protein B0I35DRAFT_408995 [Stachybotrys elegans]|uniref:Uncharacterized protein n=1 Tax=Stachybotrys elegans TaxID=80388 RepID=A0A8K0WQE6_9HYPO|nr:hypothetical protein B0I35DRAFT_408995 [Stachybotrys elegans]
MPFGAPFSRRKPRPNYFLSPTSVEGIPTFEIVSASGDTSVFEITYGESKAALGMYMSDGPLPLAAAMDTYRVNRYNVSEPEVITNRLVQGAFRYQKLNLSSTGTLVLRNVGVHQTLDTTPLTQLPGLFTCADEKLNAIWKVGARTLQITEIPGESVPDFWEITPEGSLVDSLAPQGLGNALAVLGHWVALVACTSVGIRRAATQIIEDRKDKSLDLRRVKDGTKARWVGFFTGVLPSFIKLCASQGVVHAQILGSICSDTISSDITCTNTNYNYTSSSDDS